MMKILATYGSDDLAKVYVAQMRNSKEYLVEFVESIQPPLPREEKWVLIVSTLFGCPAGCQMCDAGGGYKGRLNSEEILGEIEYLVQSKYPDGKIPVPKFKIQFARMGDPALNSEVLTVLEKLPEIYDAPGLLPSISTVAPINSEDFLRKLIHIKNRFYKNGQFQMQFSVHTTDTNKRNMLIPVPTLSFGDIAAYGEEYYTKGDQKIALNFAVSKGYPVDASSVRHYFDPDLFIIKLTPVNPTETARHNGLISEIDACNPSSANQIINDFRSQGFDVILSIGEVEENKIGSNCGQFITQFKQSNLQKRNYACLCEKEINISS